MAITLQGKMSSEGPALYYSDAWMNTMESHMRYLREHPDTTFLIIDAHDAYKYEGDLWGLLLKYNQPAEYCWLIARMNNLDSPSAYTENMLQLLVPTHEVVERLRAIFQTVYKKIN